MSEGRIILARYSVGKTIAMFAFAAAGLALFYSLPVLMDGGLDAFLESGRRRLGGWIVLALVLGPLFLGWVVLTLINHWRGKGVGIVVERGQLSIIEALPLTLSLSRISQVRASRKYPGHIEIVEPGGRLHLKSVRMMEPGRAEIIERISALAAMEAAQAPEPGPFTPPPEFRDVADTL